MLKYIKRAMKNPISKQIKYYPMIAACTPITIKDVVLVRWMLNFFFIKNNVPIDFYFYICNVLAILYVKKHINSIRLNVL